VASGDDSVKSEIHGEADTNLRKANVLRNRWKPYVRAFVAPAGALIALCGCMIEGDFGRTRPSLIYQGLNDTVSNARDFILDESPRFALTADELELRDAAYYFNEALPVHALSGRALLQGGTYADHLTASGYTLGQAQLKTISEELQADHHWFRRFARAVRKILNADAERQAQLRISSHILSDKDRARAFSRIKENRLLIHTALRDLGDRIAAYDYAVERGRVEHPGAMVRDVGRSIDSLREKVSNLRTEIAKFQRYVSPRTWNFRPVRPKSRPQHDEVDQKNRRSEKPTS